MSTSLSEKARWIWRDADPFAYHEYLRVRKRFFLTKKQLLKIQAGAQAGLSITAESLYQAWMNGRVIGHGPAKSAEGKRPVDQYDIADFLVAGSNQLDLLVLSVGVGTMTACAAEAGVIFQVNLPGRIVVSNASALVQPDASRGRKTVRRWMLPCQEDVDAAAGEDEWRPAKVIRKQVTLYPRRVPLPSREPLLPRRFVSSETVRLPDFSCSFRIKPYLTKGEEQRRNNLISTPACIVTDIVSPVAQAMEFVPTLGNVTWYFEGKVVFKGSGWEPWPREKFKGIVRLKKGANRLVGIHERSHFEDISLCAFVKTPVRAVNPFGTGGFQVIPMDRTPGPEDLASLQSCGKKGVQMGGSDGAISKMPEMDPGHTMVDGNAHDLVINAKVLRDTKVEWSEPLRIPASVPGEAVRVVLDLGVLHNGWISFDVLGSSGGRLIVSFLEAIKESPPRRIQWPAGSNNALTYRLCDGRQSFESFLPYGARYVAIHHAGASPVQIGGLKIFTANCGSRRRGFLQSSDTLVNGIYRIAVQSIVSATDDTFTDCPTFEQVNWNYDNRMCMLTDFLSCANVAVARNSLELFAEDPRYPGLVRSQYPSAWDSRIPLWSFHWIMACRDYYWHTGDVDFVKTVFSKIASGIEEALGMVNADGLFEWRDADVWHFVEWGHGRDDDHAIVGGEQAGLAGALEAAEYLGALAGGRTKLRQWRSARQNLIHAVNRRMWDRRRDAYVDSIHEDGSRSAVCSQVTNAMMAIYGVGNPAWTRRLARRLHAGDSRLLRYGSPCGVYYVLELFDKLGMVEDIFNIVRHRWGEMVLEGDTTTWEHFGEFGHAGFPTRSRCHPFASYVSKYLVKYLLGIEALAPAFAGIRIQPRPPKGIDFCRGAIPTPHGLIRVGWERAAGKIRLGREVPKGIRVSEE